MSNGVEVIVATDRSPKPLEPEFLRFLMSTVTRPITLAPHTLTNLMSMVLSSEQVGNDHNRLIAFIQPTFTTKTFFTTYNYKTTTIENDSTVVTNAKTAVTNVKTVPRCKVTESDEVESMKTVFMTLDTSPTLKTEVYNTEYTYLNTFLDGEQPLVMSSTQVISNTVVGLGDSFNELEPSEVFPSTNTYLKTVELTKSLTDGTDHHIISTSDVVTQVVVTHKPTKRYTQIPITTNVTKTYFVTYTYFSTYLEGDRTKVKSDVSVSSDVTIEKFYIKPRKTEETALQKPTKIPSLEKVSSLTFPFNLVATRTYLTTFTYFTTLLHESNQNSHTRVVENTITETIPPSDFNTDYLLKLNSSFQGISDSVIVTATLKEGEPILVTAYRNSPLKDFYEKYEIKPTLTNEFGGYQTEWSQIKNVEESLENKVEITQTQAPFDSMVNYEPQAEALVSPDQEEEEENAMSVADSTATTMPPSLSSTDKSKNDFETDYSSDLTNTSKSTQEGATTINDETAESPVTQTAEKNLELNQTAHQTNVNPLLNFSSFGINGMSVLGPVFNVMAELINHKIHKNGEVLNRRNDTAAQNPVKTVKEPSSTNTNPILNFVNKFTLAPTKTLVQSKTKGLTTPRTPVYIPVGSFGQETDISENQNRRVLITNEQDIHAKNLEKIKLHEGPVTILEGGIPISPGQVITTNSDVIIGTPGESGPRPPNFALKNDVPVDMKPPPVPPNILPVGDEDHYIGQASANSGINLHFVQNEFNIGPTSPSSLEQTHEKQGVKIARPHMNGHKDYKTEPHHRGNPPTNKHSHLKYDSGTLDLNPPPVPPPKRTQEIHKPLTINHKPVHESQTDDHPYSEHDLDHDHGHSVHPIPINLVQNYLSSPELKPTFLNYPTVSLLSPINHGSVSLISTSTPNLGTSNIESVFLVPTVGDTSVNLNLMDGSTGHPFLVNIQPSQVANIVIPHGSTTALIVNEGKQHSLKGKVIDDPSPHPELETVGFVGAEPVLKLESEDVPVSLQNEVIPAETVEVFKTSPQVSPQSNSILLSGQSQLPTDVSNEQQKLFGDIFLNNQPISPAENPFATFTNSQYAQHSSQINHQNSAFLGQQHHSNPIGGMETQSHHNHKLDIQKSESYLFNNVKKSNGQNDGKEIEQAEKIHNYRNEPNLNAGPVSLDHHQNVLNTYGGLPFQRIPSNLGSTPQNHQPNPDDSQIDKIKFKQEQIFEKGKEKHINEKVREYSNQSLNFPHRDVIGQNQPPLKEIFTNHQTGIVSDVPLSQILLQSEQKEESHPHPLKNLLIKHNSHNRDSIPLDPKQSPQFFEGPSPPKRPNNDFDRDLSPPPPPRPPIIPPFPMPIFPKTPQRYRPHSHQSRPPVPMPLEFMIPPPETPSRVKVKPQPEQSRPLIPIGAMAPVPHYPQQRPEDKVTNPLGNQPEFAATKQKHRIPGNSQVYYDLDVSDTSGAVTMEKGEEMQESVPQAMFPGKVINDVIPIDKNHSNLPKHQNNKPHRPLTIDKTRNQMPNEDDGNLISEISKIRNNSNQISFIRPGHNRTQQTKSPVGADSLLHTITNSDQIFENHKSDESLKHHHNLQTNKESYNIFNYQKPGNIFDSLKISPGRRPSGPSIYSGSQSFSPNKHSNVTIPGTVVRVSKPNIHPSEFTKNENWIKSKPSMGTPHITRTSTVKVDIDNEPVGQHSTKTEVDSNNAFFGLKDKPNLLNNHQLPSKKPLTTYKINEVNKEPSDVSENFDTVSSQSKKPLRFGPSNRPTHNIQFQSDMIKLQNSSRPFYASGSQLGEPFKNANGVSAPEKTNKNRLSLTQSTSASNFSPATSTNFQKRPYLPFESFNRDTPQRKPSGFQQPAKEDDKTIHSSESDKLVTTEQKNTSVESSYFEQSIISENLPANFSSVVSANQNYENQTTNFYDSKPAFDLSKVHKTYNKVALGSDKRLASNFSNKNNNINKNHNYNNTILSSANAAVAGERPKNATLIAIKPPMTTDTQATLVSPPKTTDIKTKVDEVMGLSPPPLERPRRPPPLQRPQRPKPHHKFDGSITLKPPIAIENDFPPVRSPDFNRKPFKPQDIFPPRLPDNFVHHLPEHPPLRGSLKPRPIVKPVTSLPIDIPTTGKQDKPTRPYSTTHDSYDLEENSGEDDPYFAGSEINGHSKPIISDVSVGIKKPTAGGSSFSKKKPGISSKLPDFVQQTSQVKINDETKPNLTENQIKPNVSRYLGRDEISPTPVISVPKIKSDDTKMTPSVTLAATRPYKKWQETDIITGSETALEEPNHFNSHMTPDMNGAVKNNQIVTSSVSTESTAIFDGHITHSPIEVSKDKSLSTAASNINSNNATWPSIVPTRTTTLTVTSTMTTVVHSVGHEPFTKTIVLTKTLISTVINKITETTTLVKPTTSTLYQTHTVSAIETSTTVSTIIHPSSTKYPMEGSLKPEIFVAVPHAKNTMTISVSSSMNKNGQNIEEKTQPMGVSGKDSIMVVVSNEKSQENFSDDDAEDEDLDDKIEVSDEENEVIHSRVMVGGVFDAEVDKEFKESINKEDECFPACKAKRNELCQKIKGIMKCICRPGFARMFPDRPCRPTYTYEIKLALEKLGPERLQYGKNVAPSNSAQISKLTSVTKEGLDRMIMQSELRDVYHGIVVNGFQGKEKTTMVDFYVQLSENTDEEKLVNILKQTLQASNYSLGGTELFAGKEADNLNAEDFNECLNPKYHDCSEHARCFNLKGTYTCSCKEGYTDMSENTMFPGRICSDAIGCEYCGYHGVCYSKGEGQTTCECFQWYSGERCNINLKVLLIALATIGIVLLALLLVCGVLTCLNRRNKTSTTGKSNGYLRYRGPSSHSVDRRAMISDSSSESSVDNLPYLSSPPMPKADAVNGKKKPVLRHIKGPIPRPPPPPGLEQRDRTLTVMIPRAKYRSPPHLSSHMTMSTFSPEKHLPKPVGQSVSEQKLISYLDGNTREERTIVNNKSSNGRQEGEQSKSYDFKISSTNINEISKTMEKKKELRGFEYEYKISNMSFSEETNSAERRSGKSIEDRFRRHSDFANLHSDSNGVMQFRKYSAGALVSAGYEVSAKVGMHQLDDDTIEDDQSGVTNTHTIKSNRSEFTTLNRTGDHKTMSEARSYDETTVHPQTRSLKTNYSGSSPSSRANNDENHTMIERDLGSTFILPKSQLFKPEADRGSDISNFDSL